MALTSSLENLDIVVVGSCYSVSGRGQERERGLRKELTVVTVGPVHAAALGLGVEEVEAWSIGVRARLENAGRRCGRDDEGCEGEEAG